MSVKIYCVRKMSIYQPDKTVHNKMNPPAEGLGSGLLGAKSQVAQIYALKVGLNFRPEFIL